jgi:erythromycin esterase-like protein
LKYFFALPLFLLFYNLAGQTINAKYDLNFEHMDACNTDWLQYKQNCTFARKNGVLRIVYNGTPARGNMKWTLSNQIVLPQKKYGALTIALKVKNNADSNIVFTIIGVDSNERIAFREHARLQRSTGWKTISLARSNTTAKAINVIIRYEGNAEPSQATELQYLRILLDGKDLTGELVTDVEKPFATLDANVAKSLPKGYNGHLQKYIPDIDSIRIIGLGENTHGSKSIAEMRMSLIKNMVLYHQCKLILMEGPYDDALLFDLYVQGIITDRDLVKAYLKLYPGHDLLLSLMDWLKEYNNTSGRKVHLLAFDNRSNNPSYALMDYYTAVLGSEHAGPFLRKIFVNDLSELVNLSKKDSLLKNRIGPDNFKLLVHILSNRNVWTGDGFFVNRDSLMYLRTTNADSLLLQQNEKVAILAHAIHLQKSISLENDTFSPTLGSFLSQLYKKRYYAIDMNFGSGSYVQDSCSTLTKMVETINKPPANSFESAALMLPYDVFLYPSKHLTKNIKTTAYILRGSRSSNYFRYASLKNRFDAIVFLRESRHFEDVEENTYTYWLRFRSTKEEKYKSIRQQYILEQMKEQ